MADALPSAPSGSFEQAGSDSAWPVSARTPLSQVAAAFDPPFARATRTIDPLPRSHAPAGHKVPAALRSSLIPRDAVSFRSFVAAGSHSRVYLGMFEGRDVAVKTTLALTSEITLDSLKEGRALDETEYKAAVEALIAEAVLLSQLPRHPHIVEYVGTVIDDRGVMLVMGFVSKVTAADLFVGNAKERAKKSWASLVQTCVEVASALEFMHAQSPPVLHVDVAARNVLIDATHGWARLADFGLARRPGTEPPVAVDFAPSVSAGADLAAAAAAASGAIEESDSNLVESLPLRIVAPEVLVDVMGDFTRASDVYAFGMLLYEILVGATPWGHGADPAIVARLAIRGARPPLPPPPLLDAELARLIEDCWRREPASRPTMQVIRLSLQQWLERHATVRAIQEPFGPAEAVASAAYVNEASAAEVFAETVAARGVRKSGRDATGEYALPSDSRGDDGWGRGVGADVDEYARPPEKW